MRLIDANKLIAHLSDYALVESPGDNESTGEKRLSKVAYDAIQNCIKAVDEQPTAYDVDAVVEQMEKEKQTSTSAKTEAIIGMCGASANHYCGEEYAYQKAIEIVKGGGVDGN